MDKKDIIREWIKSAEQDRDTVNILNSQYKKPFEIICYHCQQTVEKYLKACLILYDFPLIKTHDLYELSNICKQKK